MQGYRTERVLVIATDKRGVNRGLHKNTCSKSLIKKMKEADIHEILKSAWLKECGFRGL